jgi:hypothetical protein
MVMTAIRKKPPVGAAWIVSEFATSVMREQRRPSVLAKSQLLHGRATKGVFHIPSAAFAAHVVTGLMVDVVAYFRVVGIVEPFENVLDLLQVIAFVFTIHIDVVDCRVHFDADDVTEFAFRIDRAFAAIARVMNHRDCPMSVIKRSAIPSGASPSNSS